MGSTARPSRTLSPLAVCVVFAFFISGPTFGQPKPAPARPGFEIADIHAVPYTNRSMFGGALRNGRYEVRRATLLDLIKTAYAIGPETIYGGPSWLDYDRFDVIAKAPPATPPATVRLMLQTLLADRFKLVLHKDTKPMPAYVLSLGEGQPKMNQAAGSGPIGCTTVPKPAEPGNPASTAIACRNVTMTTFAQSLRGISGGVPAGYLNIPGVDSTGLKGRWDFDLKWSPRVYLPRQGPEEVTLFDAIDQQLGLKLESRNAPLPVLAVDSANEKPTPNPPGVATSLPPAVTAFEVASIRPSQPDTPPVPVVQPGGRVNFVGTQLGFLIQFVWQDETIVGAPKWLESGFPGFAEVGLLLSGPRFDIVAKATTTAGAPPLEMDELRPMIRTLLEDRFKLATHHEDRPADAYTLVAEKPTLKKADPSTRTGCKQSTTPSPAFPPPTVLTCQNVTMAQFAERLQTAAPVDIHSPVLDSTGLSGGYDITLTFSSGSGATASGASLFSALEKQLGLKLEMRQRPLPVLVIDHVEEKPTDN